MKKFLCFALVLCLALAPVGVFAEDYDNGENGYDVEDYATDDESTDVEVYEDDATDEPTDDATDAEVEEDEPTEEIEEASAVEEVQTTWIFGMGDDSTDGWIVMSGEVDVASGYATPVYDEDAVFRWMAPFAGTFTVTGSVAVENAMFVVLGGGYEAGNFEDYDFEFEAEMNMFGSIHFSARIINEDEDASAIWNITITGVPAVEEAEEVEEVVDEVEEIEEAEEVELPAVLPIEPPAAEPVVDYPLPGVLAGVPTRTVDGVEFVAFRLFANAHGYYALAWDGATSTVTVVDVVSFTLAEAGGFNDNGTVYVPMTFALTLFQ